MNAKSMVKNYNSNGRKMSDSHSQIEQNNYWKERVDLLLYEKKKWMQEKKKIRGEMNDMKTRMDIMEQRNKHLQNVIHRFGNYDTQEFEFDNGRISDINNNTPQFQKDQDIDTNQKEIDQEYIFNRSVPSK